MTYNEENNTNWALAKAKLGISAGQEENELLKAGKAWNRYIEDLLQQSSSAFKKRNLASAVGGKLGTIIGGIGGKWLGGDSKWSKAAEVTGSTLGSAGGRYAGTLAADPDSINPNYQDFLDANPDIDVSEGKFYKSKREAFKKGQGLDMTAFAKGKSDAYSEEAMANILSGMTDVYTMNEWSKDGDLDWLYDLFR
jgi:hypothetical protein